ncbi:MAG TPA: pantoate--beta-alanine ligase [Bacteroidia bacterium]|nr:pantoate--beta-alanine ligase [Bacteroidia bacterium]
MNVFNSINDLRENLLLFRENNKSIGFVPTMGALHAGHIALIEKAKAENDVVVCSIFVNPTQFNDKKDLEKYPRTLDADKTQLAKANCSILFVPETSEIYPEKNDFYTLPQKAAKINFGILDKVMEAKLRPGHFSGVINVVSRLFEIVAPQKAYFGEKDFQQLSIIKKLITELQLPIQLIPCPITRENDGLAMSSRNIRLTSEERKVAPFIHQTLLFAKNNFRNYQVNELKTILEKKFLENTFFKLEYAEICDVKTLVSIDNYEDTKSAILCVALQLGSIRLIDNIILIP